MAAELTERTRERLEGTNFWSVATVTPDGAPHATPMRVGLEDGLIVFNTSVGRINQHLGRADQSTPRSGGSRRRTCAMTPGTTSPTPTPRTPTTAC
ncbi:pyridoxamine 5'-phosphate oxidase family protein [Streptomyces incarnatus]